MQQTFRQRLFKWSLFRFLRAARSALVRDPSPGRIRRDMARFDKRAGGSISFTSLPVEQLEHCSVHWVNGVGAGATRYILYLHGGAFVAESPNVHCAMLARLCERAGARGLYVSYRLAPEHPYPAATDDCLAAYRHLLSLGVDSRQIVIAGDSAGGNLTIVTALRIRDLGEPAPAALVALSPVLDATFSGDSMRRNDGLDPLFRSAIVADLAHCYVPEPQRRDPYVSPLFGSLDGLPPALVLVGSSEILLDDSTRYAARARNVTLQVWHGMPHVFPVMHGLAEADAAVQAIADYVVGHTSPAPAVNPSLSPPTGC